MLSVDDLRALLAKVYVHDDEYLSRQCERYAGAARHFVEVFGFEPTRFYRAPGRVNLIGEHTDYNLGYVMPTAIDRDVVIAARPRQDDLFRAANVDGERFEPFQFHISQSVVSGPVGHWSNYPRGAAQRLARAAGRPLLGMDAVFTGTQPYGTPMGVGLSSSTSLTVVSTLAIAHRNGMHESGQMLAELASQAEWYVGTRGGVMDHFASVLGRGGHALFLDCMPEGPARYRMDLIPLPTGYRLVVCSTNVRHENTRSEFNSRVFECRVAAYMIRQTLTQVRHLRDVSEEHLGLSRSEIDSLISDLLPEAVLGSDLIASGIAAEVAADMPASFEVDGSRPYRVRQRCRHVVTENRRVIDGAQALRLDDMEAFGRLMGQAHASARDDYEVSIRPVEAMVEAANAAPGSVGARLTGAGWGGCVVAVVEDSQVEAFSDSVSRRYRKETGIASEIIVCNSATGAQAIVPT